MDKTEAKSGIILVVEDDQSLSTLLSTVLKRAGYQVLQAETGEEALKRMGEEVERIDCLYTDVRMPGTVDGWRVFEEFRSAHPSRPAVVASGYDPSGRTIDDENSRFVPKPFFPSDLVRTFRDLSNL